MNKIYSFLILISISGLSTSTFSQEKQHKYLFSGDGTNVDVSGFAAIFTQFSSINKEFAVSNGGGGVILLNQIFFIGGYGQGLSTKHKYGKLVEKTDNADNETIDNLNIRMGHGGFWFGFIPLSHSVFHITTSAKLGFGSVKLVPDNYHHDKSDSWVTDPIFVIIPEVGGEVNVTKWFRINLTVGYRIVTGLNKKYPFNVADTGPEIWKKYFDQSDFNSVTGSINLIFGWFH